MKLKFIILCIISFLCIETLNAQSSEPRSNNFRYKKIKEYEVPDEERRIPRMNFGEFSLKDYPDKNLIEINLLEQYEDVRVNKINRQYYIFDSIGNIGLANADGEVLVPPIEGKVDFYDMLILLGEETDEFDIVTINQYSGKKELNEIRDRAEMNKLKKTGYSLGLCKAVVKCETVTNKVNIAIPYNKYDYISVVPKSVSNVWGFYVCIIDDSNNILWGYCDKDGNEIIPCEYRSIYYDGEVFRGDNTKDMLEWNDYYAEQLQIKQEIRRQRQLEWAEKLNSVGEMLLDVAEMMPDNGSNTSTGSYGNNVSTTRSDDKNITPKEEDEKDVSGMLNRNSDYKAYEGYADLIIKMQTGINEYNDDDRKDYQDKMKQIRMKWVNKGYEFTKLPQEDWKP